jgi:hypothetical protein
MVGTLFSLNFNNVGFHNFDNFNFHKFHCIDCDFTLLISTTPMTFDTSNSTISTVMMLDLLRNILDYHNFDFNIISTLTKFWPHWYLIFKNFDDYIFSFNDFYFDNFYHNSTLMMLTDNFYLDDFVLNFNNFCFNNFDNSHFHNIFLL